MKKQLLVFGLVFCNLQVSWAEDKKEELDKLKQMQCREFAQMSHKLSFKYQMDSSLEVMGDMVSAIFDADNLSLLKKYNVQTKQENKIKSSSRNDNLRNVVIYMGASDETLSRMTKEEADKKIKETSEAIQKIVPQLKNLLKSSKASMEKRYSEIHKNLINKDKIIIAEIENLKKLGDNSSLKSKELIGKISQLIKSSEFLEFAGYEELLTIMNKSSFDSKELLEKAIKLNKKRIKNKNEDLEMILTKMTENTFKKNDKDLSVANALVVAGEESCLNTGKEVNFPFQELHEKIMESEKQYFERQVQATEGTVSLISNSLSKLNQDWELVESADIREISRIINAEDVGNVVIFAHASQKGTLLDSNFNELPVRMFNSISPTVKSISVYSCHEWLVKNKYNIDENLNLQKSIHKERALYTPQTIRFMLSEDSAPQGGFLGFMKRVEADLAKSNDKNDGDLKSDQRKCSIEMLSTKAIESKDYYSVSTQEFKVTKGGYQFSLNGKAIGYLNKESRDSKIEFDCDLLKDNEKNVIINQDYTSSLDSKILEENQYQLFLTIPGKEVQVINGENFKRDDKSYRSSKFTFNLLE